MSTKSLVILLLLALVLGGIAVKTSRTRNAAAPAALGKPVLPELPVNDVERLRVVNQSSTATVARVNGQWVLLEKHNYPASFARISDTVVKLSELKIADRRHVTPETRKRFGIVEPDPAQPEATRVELAGKDGKTLATVMLGKSHLRKAPNSGAFNDQYPDGRYVSADGGETVYLVKEPLNEISALATTWMETELLHVDAEELTRLTITGPNQEPLELSKADAGGPLTVSNLAATEEADDAKLASLRNALAYLNLQDVADPALGDAAMGFDAPVSITAETADGRVYKLLIGAAMDGGARYLRAHAEFREPAPAGTNATDIAASATNAAATRATVDTLNRKLANWTFVIPSYKAETLAITRADLVKPKATPPPETDAAPAQPDEAAAPLPPTTESEHAASATEAPAAPAADHTGPIAPAPSPVEGPAPEETHDEHKH